MSKPDNKNEEIKQLVLTTDPDNISEELLNKFSGITSLDLSYSDFENIDILVNFPNLTHLDLGDCDALENLDIVSSLTNLTSLDLSWCNSLQDVDGLANLPNLTSLALGWCNSLQNADVLSGLTNLTSLDLRSCSFLQNADALIKLKNLTILYLGSCKSLQNVDGLAKCTKLTELNLSWCNSLQNVDIVSSLTNLTSLDLACCSKLQNLGGLASLTNLTSLDLSSCESLQNIENIVALPNLNKLSIATPYNQKKSIQLPDLIDQCVNLEHLDLSGYDFTLPSGLGRLTRLKILSLGSNNRSSNIGDDTLQLISELINLEELDLWKCKNISDRGLVYLSKNLNLKRLDLIGTRVTDKAVNKLKDKLPGLTILWRLFEQTLSVCKDPATEPDELERIFNRFMFGDELDDWITDKAYADELEYVHLISLATALAGNPQCPSQVLKDLFNFPNDRDEMGWPEDNPLQLNVLSNPGCPVSVLLNVIRGDNDELKEAAAKSPAVKKLKPAGFGRYADPETGEIVAKMQDGKLAAVEKAE